MDQQLATPPATPARTPPRPDNGHAAPAHASSDHEKIDLHVDKPHSTWVIAGAVTGAVVLLALLITGFLPRYRNGKDLNAEAADTQNAPVVVNVARARRAPTTTEIVLSGSMRPWQEVSIFARTTGYLKKYYVDISNPVEAGQLMAVIESPEVDQELRQSQAALAQTNAAVVKATTDLKLAQVTYDRYKELIASKTVSQQDLDEKQSALAAGESTLESAKANVGAAEANVQRLTEMQQFEKVTAPFSGVITGRAYDNGSLILANPTATDVKPLFKIAQNDVLRAFVNVPQSSALQIKKGMDVKITARERPNRVFMGKVMGTTNYLDPASRSLLTEVKVPNEKESDGEFALLPGMYVQATFDVIRDTPPLVIPAPAIVNNASGTQVAIIRNGAAHFQKVVLGQDFGNEIEVVDGLVGDEQIVANPGERIAEGVAVKSGSDNPGEPAAPNPQPKEKVAALAK